MMLKRLVSSWFDGNGKAPSPTLRPPVRFVRAKFDSAQTTTDNRRHWANADGLSPNAALSPEVRRILRNRARYEVANNSYAKGIVLTLANDTIGTGPRLQMLTGYTKAQCNRSRIHEPEFDHRKRGSWSLRTVVRQVRPVTPHGVVDASITASIGAPLPPTAGRRVRSLPISAS